VGFTLSSRRLDTVKLAHTTYFRLPSPQQRSLNTMATVTRGSEVLSPVEKSGDIGRVHINQHMQKHTTSRVAGSRMGRGMGASDYTESNTTTKRNGVVKTMKVKSRNGKGTNTDMKRSV